MTTTMFTNFSYPEGISQMIFEGFQEVIGRSSMEILFGQRASSANVRNQFQFNFADVAALKARLQQMYGLSSAQGLMLRAGRASFLYWLRAYGPQTQITDIEFRLLPTRIRLKKGLETLARTFREECGFQIRVYEEGDSWFWEMSGCPDCGSEAGKNPHCSFTIGLLQEYLAWASGGKFYPVKEAAGGRSPCKLEISRQPID